MLENNFNNLLGTTLYLLMLLDSKSCQALENVNTLKTQILAIVSHALNFCTNMACFNNLEMEVLYFRVFALLQLLLLVLHNILSYQRKISKDWNENHEIGS